MKVDYWDASDETTQPANDQSKQPDRQGLTGSVRLLQDITRFDEFAFETNRRKLQLAATFSLPRLFPVEIQRFRETDRLPFVTPMTLFDQGFPGHYLRLIKRVSLSIVSLVPLTRGVRATLMASGNFPCGGRRRHVPDHHRVARSGADRPATPRVAGTRTGRGNAAPLREHGGGHELGIAASQGGQSLRLPTIADVLFTVEYTALQDFSYRKQVIQQLSDTVSAASIFSICDQFTDQWYDLHNPERVAAPMTVKFALTSDSFPSNLDDLRIQQVLFAVVRAVGHAFEVGATQLMLTPQGETIAVGGPVGAPSMVSSAPVEATAAHGFRSSANHRPVHGNSHYLIRRR
ncbi:Tc toxin subunit A-related protein [Methylomonas sp. MgM2]